MTFKLTSEVERRLVWDVPVRAVHWSVVIAVAGSWISARLGPAWFSLHLICGCTVIVLVTFRIAWGFVGTRHARFSSFVRGPRAVYSYLRAAYYPSAMPMVGHNPLGAISVVLMLLLLLGQGLSGLFANDAIANTGPLYGWVSGATSDELTSLHDRIFLVLEFLIALHITMVLYYSLIRRVRLIGPMLSGYKPAEQVPPAEGIDGSRLTTAAVLLIIIVCLLALILYLAPPAGLSSF